MHFTWRATSKSHFNVSSSPNAHKSAKKPDCPYRTIPCHKVTILSFGKNHGNRNCGFDKITTRPTMPKLCRQIKNLQPRRQKQVPKRSAIRSEFWGKMFDAKNLANWPSCWRSAIQMTISIVSWTIVLPNIIVNSVEYIEVILEGIDDELNSKQRSVSDVSPYLQTTVPGADPGYNLNWVSPLNHFFRIWPTHNGGSAKI